MHLGPRKLLGFFRVFSALSENAHTYNRIFFLKQAFLWDRIGWSALQFVVSFRKRIMNSWPGGRDQLLRHDFHFGFEFAVLFEFNDVPGLTIYQLLHE